ncbi:MAG: molybdopterin-dependent oxidoreductase [Syntrophales bacterium]
MISLIIDGKEVFTEEGKTILEAARASGIYIPTFCFHEKLFPIGSCRLCLVEVDGYDKPMTACTTPALAGIKVTIQSDKLFRMRQQFLQLILTSHPLDCPQCDKGGECQLQNISYEHKIEKAEYEAVRKDHREEYATPLIRYWEARCVLCGRCFNACREVSGRAAIDIVGNGFEARIAASDAGDCISCGECLSVCPVGALTEKLSPVKARTWQSQRIETTCPHCGFGCQLTLNVVDGKIITKVVTEKNLPPNNDSLCVRGRFGYDFVNSDQRLREPYQGNQKKTLTKEEALSYTAENMKKLSAEGKGVGFIVSPRATNEELFLISKIASTLKNSQIASAAAYHTGKVASAFARMGISPVYDYEKIKSCKTIVVAGADLLINNHLLANKVREAVKFTGARIVSIDPLDHSLARIASAHLQALPGSDAGVFNALSARLLEDGKHDKTAETFAGFAELKQSLSGISAEALQTPGGVDAGLINKAYQLIADTDSVCVIFASGITDNEASLTALLNFCLLKGLPERGLVMAAALQANALGAVSLLKEMAAPDSLLDNSGISGIFLYEDDPFQYLNGELVKKSLARQEFVAVCDILPTRVMDSASIVIPSAGFAEKDGSFISGNGAVSTVHKACSGPSAGFDFLNSLLGLLGGKSYENSQSVAAEIRLGGLFAKGGDGVETLAVKTDKPAFAKFSSGEANQPAHKDTGRYKLILRDLFMNHHLSDMTVYGEGVGRVQTDLLRISPEDAAELNVSTGDVVALAGDAGAATSPVVVKKGIRKGSLECVLFSKHGEMLSLFARPAKVNDVAVKKA